MNFCSTCGQPVQLRTPPGDHLPRHVCGNCGAIHYLNPRIVVGCVPEWQGKILLCRRAINPRRGFWTTPAGFLENGESLQQGAARETREEAEASVEIGSLLAVVNLLYAHQVHINFRARLLEPRCGAGSESLEVGLYLPEDIPWAEMAFDSTIFSLRRYLADREAGVEGLHFLDLSHR